MSAAGKVCTGFSMPYVAKYSNVGSVVTYSGVMQLARGVSVSLSLDTTDDNVFHADNVSAETAAAIFTGGTATGYDLTLGSGSFIDGFEDQIIGHNVGDTFDVTVTFPDGYGDSTDAEGNTITLSGKEAVFSVTLNSISESVTPELTDEWVDSNFGISDDLHTVDQLRSYFNDALYATNYENAIVDYLMENSEFKAVPSVLTSYYIRMFLSYYNQYASRYGMDLDAFAQTQGYTDADAMLAASDSYFEHLAKQDLIFQAVADAENITPTQEQIDAADAEYADTYGQNRARLNALQSCVLDWLEDHATVS